MIRRLLFHEWRAILTSVSMWFVVAIFTAATVYSIVNGSRVVGAIEEGLRRLDAEQREKMANHQAKAREIEQSIASGTYDFKAGVPPLIDPPYPTPRHPFYVSWGAHPMALLPPTFVSQLTLGEIEMYPAAYRVKNTDYGGIPIESTTNPFQLLTGRLDLEMIVLYLLPLFIILLTFDLVAAEKENGTLSLLLSQPLSLRKLIAAKILARVIVAAVVIIGSALLGVWLSGIATELMREPDRLLLWILAAILYGLFWLALAIWVNALGRSSAFNALALVGAWMFFVILMPALANLAANIIAPAPLRSAYINTERQADFDLANDKIGLAIETEEARAKRQELLDKFLSENPQYKDKIKDQQKYGPVYLMLQTRYAEEARRLEAAEAPYQRAAAQQENIVAWVSLANPAMLFRNISREVAGSSKARARRFQRQVRLFNDEWMAFLLPKLFAYEPVSASDYDRMPRFKFDEEPTSAVFRRNAGAFGLLALAPILLCYFGLRRLQRYPIVG